MSKQRTTTPLPRDGRSRVRVEAFSPTVDAGRHPVKRVVGERMRVEVDLVCDGHDEIAGTLHVDAPNGSTTEVRLERHVGDRFFAHVELGAVGQWSLQVAGWVDAFATWRHGLERKLEAELDVSLELLEGAALIAATAARAKGAERASLQQAADRLADENLSVRTRAVDALSTALAERMAEHPDRTHETRSERYPVVVDPIHARYSTWYEMFPRSRGVATEGPTPHGTFADAQARLPYIAQMGFDVVYLPPIHPIGRTFRKGPNNTLRATAEDVGSPWAIGGPEGGHTAIHPELGNLEDFRGFCKAATARGLRVALDIAFQCSPDHPWVEEHPQWFRRRPDGSIQYAENPPKKYQDVYPFDFETDDWQALWAALRDVFLHWASAGVRIFRVDNPHTKPLPFWEWCLSEVKALHPDAVFLSEAFTRPKLMYALAKVGFSQSYTYFTWRTSKWELETYLHELTRTSVREFFRPNFWPNTPDILPEELQWGGRAAFVSRLVLAATLSSNYGIYGPAFELMESQARPGSGEYVDNEKYQLRDWDIERPDSLRGVITRINQIRASSPALQQTNNLRFHEVDNERILCFSKTAGDDLLLVVVNLDHHHRQSGWVQLDLGALGIAEHEPYQVHDLLGDGRYLWNGPRNYVEIDPHALPAQIFRLRHRVRTERDFDYFV
jgi:starch synthase (maltosyl-transferring)